SRPVLRLHGDEPPRVVHLVDGDGSLGDGAASALPPSSPPSASPPSASARASSTTPAGGSAKEAYDEALALVRAREFQRAAEALRAFLENHPETPFSDNALYWLGECHYARGAYAEARKEFERLIERYPHENKVP